MSRKAVEDLLNESISNYDIQIDDYFIAVPDVLLLGIDPDTRRT